MGETGASVVEQAVERAAEQAVELAVEQAVAVAAAAALLPLIIWCWKDLEPGDVAAEL